MIWNRGKGLGELPLLEFAKLRLNSDVYRWEFWHELLRVDQASQGGR